MRISDWSSDVCSSDLERGREQKSDPVKEINKYAIDNRLNAQRIRLWFFSYLCFGQGQWILAPRYFNCCKWDRLSHSGEKPFGRKPIARGNRADARMNAQVIEKIVSSYYKRRSDGKTMTSIYRDAMSRDFGAKVITDECGSKRLVALDASPLPSLEIGRAHV